MPFRSSPQTKFRLLADDTKLAEVTEKNMLCYHPEGYQQAGEMGWWELHETQQREMPSSTPPGEQPHAPVHAGCR